MNLNIETVFEHTDREEIARLPDALRAAYDGDLRLPESTAEWPLVMANFVSTLDGVVSFDMPGQSGGGPISGANAGDHFIMGLLRASADVVLVGAGTVNAVSHSHLWTADYIYPEKAELYARYRRSVLAKSRHPLIAIVSGTGRVDLSRSVFHTPDIEVLLLTTETGQRVLVDAGVEALSSTTIRVLPASDGKLRSIEIVRLLKSEFRAGMVLHEGGPTLFGQFLADGVVDELFLTLAPQVAGRMPKHFRPALVMNAQFLPGNAPWLSLLSVKRAGDHLFLRYRVAAGKKV